MKTLVLYKTKWGSSKEYAEWLSEDIKSDIYSVDDFNSNDLNIYERVILFSRTFIGNIEILPFIVNNWSILKEKKVVLVAVGLVDPNSEQGKASYNKIPSEIRSNIFYFKVKGKVERSKLPMALKVMYSLVKGKIPEISGEMKKDNLLPVFENLGEGFNLPN